jgi:hypothetical protein
MTEAIIFFLSMMAGSFASVRVVGLKTRRNGCVFLRGGSATVSME